MEADELLAGGRLLAGRCMIRDMHMENHKTLQAAQMQACELLPRCTLSGGIAGVKDWLLRWDEILQVASTAISQYSILSNFVKQVRPVTEFDLDIRTFDRLPAEHPDKCYANLRGAVDAVLPRRRAAFSGTGGTARSVRGCLRRSSCS